MFECIIDGVNIASGNIDSMMKLLNDDSFEVSYNSVLNQIAFDDVTREDMKTLFETIKF